MSELVDLLRTPTGCTPPTKWELQAADRIEALEAQIQEDTVRFEEDADVMVEATVRIKALEAALREIIAIHEANIGRDAELSLHSWEVARAALAPEQDK